MKIAVFAAFLFVAGLATRPAIASGIAPIVPTLDVQPDGSVWSGDTVTIDITGIQPGQFLFLFFSPTLGETDLGIAQIGLSMPLALQFLGYAQSTSFHASEEIPPMPAPLGGFTMHTQVMAAGISFSFPIQITISVSNLDSISFASP